MSVMLATRPMVARPCSPVLGPPANHLAPAKPTAGPSRREAKIVAEVGAVVVAYSAIAAFNFGWSRQAGIWAM